MSEALQNLNENLKRQVTLYNELLILEGHKKTALIQNKLPEIEAITKREEQRLREVSHLEKERLLWTESIGRDLEKAPRDLTLLMLAEHFPVLEGVRADLEGVVTRLREINEGNSQLLQRAMQIVDFTVGLLMHQESNTYTHPNRHENEGNRKHHLLDHKI